LATVRAALPAARHNGPDYCLLFNPDLPFAARLYGAFGMSPRDLRLRVPLGRIIAAPATYDGQTVPPPLLHALTALDGLPRARTLREAHELDLFPPADGLVLLERSYGDTITLGDMYGASHPAARAAAVARADLLDKKAHAAAHLRATLNPRELFATLAEEEGHAATRAAAAAAEEEVAAEAARQRASLATFTRNIAYLDAARQLAEARASTDFAHRNVASVAERSAAASMARTSALHSDAAATAGTAAAAATMRINAAAPPLSPAGAPYLYGGQKLNAREWQMSLLREQLAAAKGATFSFQPEYGSRTVTVLAPEDIAREEAAASRRKWMTQRGFQYPAVRSMEERLAHPRRLTEARAAELAHPWPDPHDAAAVERADARRAATLPGASPFRADPDPHALPGGVFGYVDAVGHAVPAGDFYKSVHLPPGGVEDELRARKEAEAAEWRRRLVVDDPVVHCGTSRDASKAGRLASLLHDPPTKPALVAVHTARLPSGKPAPLEPAPVSMALGTPWQDPHSRAAQAIAGRTLASPAAFSCRTAAGLPLDFKSQVLPAAFNGTRVHNPIRAAAFSALAEPGSATVPATWLRGINTDAAAARSGGAGGEPAT
jgi:hypothetical protein